MRFFLGLLLALCCIGCIEDVSDARYPERNTDMGGSDIPSCEGETPQELCAMAGAKCGALVTTDRCDVERTVDCGNSCVSPNTCGALEDNQCGCTMLDDETFCGVFGEDICGFVSGNDPCGVPRTTDCGACDPGETCLDNRCACLDQSEAQACADAGAECGSLTIEDQCLSMSRVLSCGQCADTETCDEDNQCDCAPEPPAATCARLGLNCDEAQVQDNCGNIKTINCGTCPTTDPPTICGGGGTPNACACGEQTDIDFCNAQGASCGVITAMDACGFNRTVNCGGCAAFETCGAESDNECGCVDEDDLEFCARQDGVECGRVSGVDNCGELREMVDCGTCPSDETCQNNQCICPAASAAQFCSSNGAQCGSLTALECGAPRTQNCGTCPAGSVCNNANRCVCDPFTNAELCDASNACGEVTLLDNCDMMRTIDCADCGANEGDCIDGTCTVCAPDSDTQLCFREGAQCGVINVVDNCDQPRSPNCGSCDAANNFQCVNNVCQCVGSDPAGLCGPDQCGQTTVVDECNQSHSTNCGVCTGPDEYCNQGTCECQPLTQQRRTAICNAAGAECGTIEAMYCGMLTSIQCPNTCLLGLTCNYGDNTCISLIEL